MDILPYSKHWYNSYVYKCKKKEIDMELSLEEFNSLTKSNCFYCDKQPEERMLKHNRPNSTRRVNGVDRVDPSKGYTKDNSVPCCTACNRMKSDFSLTEFIVQVTSINSHLTQNIDKFKIEHILHNVCDEE